MLIKMKKIEKAVAYDREMAYKDRFLLDCLDCILYAD